MAIVTEYNHFMAKQRTLFLDESGKASFRDRSKNFVLSGCSLPTEKIDEIKHLFDLIIFKYWGSQKSYSKKYNIKKIVFHTIDIIECEHAFVILKDPKINRQFWDDLLTQIIFRTDITYYLSIVDKTSVISHSPTWTEETTLRKSYENVIDAFLTHLIASRAIGEITAETSFDQDSTLIKTFHSFKRQSQKRYGSRTLVDTKITCLSFVNKHDDDIGSQIADLIAWTCKNKYLVDQGIKRLEDLDYSQKRLLEMFNKRITSTSNFYKYNKFFAIK